MPAPFVWFLLSVITFVVFPVSYYYTSRRFMPYYHDFVALYFWFAYYCFVATVAYLNGIHLVFEIEANPGWVARMKLHQQEKIETLCGAGTLFTILSLVVATLLWREDGKIEMRKERYYTLQEEEQLKRDRQYTQEEMKQWDANLKTKRREAWQGRMDNAMDRWGAWEMRRIILWKDQWDKVRAQREKAWLQEEEHDRRYRRVPTTLVYVA